jgi:hypothetical protein
MPTLDDLPTLATVSPTGDDLIPVYDLTASGSSKVRKLPLNSVLGLAPTGDLTVSNVTTATASITAATRMLRITGTAGNTGVITVSIPAPSGNIRDIIVQYFSAGTGGSVTLNITGGGSNIFTSAAAAAVASLTAIPTGTTLRLLSDGTNWYRTH